jgi:hypothetical protein
VDSARSWLGFALLAGLALLWLGFRLGRWWSRHLQAWEGRRAQARGAEAEREAEPLLRALGYRVLARQVEGAYRVVVDGAAKQIRVTADLLVERGGDELVAEVKSGLRAPRLGHAETRRQLLEYQLAFQVASVLLVDVDARRVREVRFPLEQPAPRPAKRAWALALWGAALAALAWAWLARRG